MNKDLLIPPYLKSGDKIAIIAPARKVELEEMEESIAFLNEVGFEIVIPDGLFESESQFAGSDEHRATLINGLLSDDSIKALIVARGGYGSGRIIDLIEWDKFRSAPKWLCGFSDITMLHAYVNNVLGIASIHSPVMTTLRLASDSVKNTLVEALRKGTVDFSFEHRSVRYRPSKGLLIGGNLSLIYALTGTRFQPNVKGKILFLEDLDEHLYHFDRMILNLKQSGMLDGLEALVIGGMTQMRDNTQEFGFKRDNPFGKTAEEIVLHYTADCEYPVILGFPSGHIDDNHSLVFGKSASIELVEGTSMLRFSQ